MARQLDPNLSVAEVEELTETELLQDVRALLIALLNVNEQQLMQLGGASTLPPVAITSPLGSTLPLPPSS